MIILAVNPYGYWIDVNLPYTDLESKRAFFLEFYQVDSILIKYLTKD